MELLVMTHGSDDPVRYSDGDIVCSFTENKCLSENARRIIERIEPNVVTGYYDGNYTYQGYMSNFRYRKGTAYYTTTFTPPTGPLERTTDTELIFAQSVNNASNGYSSAIAEGADIMQVKGNVTASTSAPTLTTSSSVGVVFGGDPKFNTQGAMYFPTGETTQRGRGRAVFAGGEIYGSPASVKVNTIAYLQSCILVMRLIFPVDSHASVCISGHIP